MVPYGRIAFRRSSCAPTRLRPEELEVMIRAPGIPGTRAGALPRGLSAIVEGCEPEVGGGVLDGAMGAHKMGAGPRGDGAPSESIAPPDRRRAGGET